MWYRWVFLFCFVVILQCACVWSQSWDFIINHYKYLDWLDPRYIMELCLEEWKVDTCCPEYLWQPCTWWWIMNWTEWSAIWSQIIRVISKSVRFEITSMISDQNCMTWSWITTLWQPFWNRRIQSVPIFYWTSSRFVKKQKQKALTSHFVFETEMMQYRAKLVQFKTEIIWFTNVEHEWHDLE